MTDPDRTVTSPVVVSAGGPAVGVGSVWHRRNQPTTHEFTYRVNLVWLDPDRPDDLFRHHRLWSTTGPRPVRFRRADYLDGGNGPISPVIRNDLAETLGARPTGPIRMLTQPRTWGWVFNPITVYLVWDDDGSTDPVGAVLEVTNTPWKERTCYPVALARVGGVLTAAFDKTLHVSPFLDLDHRYDLTIGQDLHQLKTRGRNRIMSETFNAGVDTRPDRRLSININVTRPGADHPTVETALHVGLHPPTRNHLSAALRRNPLPTHRVSLGIHWQAARLARKRVPFVTHPGKRS